MAIEKLHDAIDQAIDVLIEDKLNDFSGTLIHRGQKWKISFKCKSKEANSQ